MDTATPTEANWHGKPTGYKRHLTEGTEPCAACRKAHWISKKKYRLRKIQNGGNKLRVPSIGARRRIQALATLGWSYRDLQEHTGIIHTHMGTIVQRRTEIWPSTDAKIREVYDKLFWTKNPNASKRVLNEALRKGWAPPQAWGEDEIDDPDAMPTGFLFKKDLDRWVKFNATEDQKRKYREMKQRQEVTAA